MNNHRKGPIILLIITCLLISVIIIFIFSRYDIFQMSVVTREIYVFTGILRIENTCIVLEDKTNTYTLLWPKQFEIRIREDNIYLIDYYVDLRTTWYLESEIRIRGRIVNEINWSQIEEINTHCPGPYLVVKDWLS